MKKQFYSFMLLMTCFIICNATHSPGQTHGKSPTETCLQPSAYSIDAVFELPAVIAQVQTAVCTHYVASYTSQAPNYYSVTGAEKWRCSQPAAIAINYIKRTKHAMLLSERFNRNLPDRYSKSIARSWRTKDSPVMPVCIIRLC